MIYADNIFQRLRRVHWRPAWNSFFIVVIVGIALILPRAVALGRYVTADEPAWGKRSASFYYALFDKDFSATYQTGHPGVTTMWAGAIAYHLKFPKYQKVGQTELGDTKLFLIFNKHGPEPLEVLATARLIMVIANIAALTASFLFAQSLFGTLPALIGFLLIAFNPFHVAHSRFLHTNGLLSSFMFLSFLAYLYYLREHKLLGLIISGIAAGLSFITVTPGFLLVPIIFLMTLFDLRNIRAKNPDFNVYRLARRILAPLLLWGFISMLTTFIVWPAMWSQPLSTISKTINYSISATEGEIGGAQLVDAYNVENDPESNYLYFYPLTYLWRSTPITIIGLILAILFIPFNKLSTFKPGARFNLFTLVLFVIVFTAIMSLGTKKFDRYFLPAYLPLELIAAIGWISGASWLFARVPKLRRVKFVYLVLIIVIITQMLATIRHFPYYITYFNPLMGGNRKAPQTMSLGFGEGLNEAALYLREKPNIKKLDIISWHTLAFNWYSIGLGFEVQPISLAIDISEDELNEHLASDYAVIYIDQIQRNTPRKLMEYLEKQTPEHSIWIKGVEYVRIYKLGSQDASP